MADDDILQLLKQYYGSGPPDLSESRTLQRAPNQTLYPDPTGKLYQGEISNLDRPEDRFETEQAASLSPTMGGYGMGQMAEAAITKASDPLGPDWLGPEGVAKVGLPLMLGMFAGPGAKTADLAALAKAHEMAGKGLDRGMIWHDTGWYQNPIDNQWKHEVPDDKAYYAAKGYQGGVNGDKILPEVLGHKDLYKAYPDMKGITSAWRTGPAATEEIVSGGPKAGYGEHADLGEFIAGLGHNKEDLISSFLHEAQHAIQNRENFAPGGNQEMFTPEQIEAERDRLFQNPSFAEDNPDLSSDQKLAFDMYRRLAGEVEARNAQKRQMYTPEMRRLIPPWETQDTPYDQQINSTPMFDVEKSHAYSVPQETGQDTPARPQAGYPGDQSPALPGQVEPEEGKTIDQILRETYPGVQMSMKDSSVSGNPSEQVDTSRPLTSNSVGAGNESLSYLLNPPSKNASILGTEKGKVAPNGVSVLKSANAPEGYGSDRLVMAKDGKIVGAMQVTKVPGGAPTVANTYVDPAFRRQGIATALNSHAQSLYGDLDRSPDASPQGEAFRGSLDRTYPGDSTSRDVGVGSDIPPLRGYHGTAMPWEGSFDPTRVKAGPHLQPRPYFADNPEEASGYALQRDQTLQGNAARGDASAPSVIPADIQIKKPFNGSMNAGADGKYDYNIIPSKEYKKLVGVKPERDKATGYDVIKAMYTQEADKLLSPEIRATKDAPYDPDAKGYWGHIYDSSIAHQVWEGIYKRLEKAGYDGIVEPGTPSDYAGGRYTKIIPFKRGTVKSATTKEPLFAEGGKVSK